MRLWCYRLLTPGLYHQNAHHSVVDAHTNIVQVSVVTLVH